MELKNLLVVNKNWGDAFEEQAKKYDSRLHREEFQPQSQAANRSSFLNREVPSNASVSYGPPPSFLIRTPLGTPHEGTVELKQRAEIPVIRQQEGTADTVPLSKKTFEQAKQAPKKFKQKTEPSKKNAKSYKRNGDNGFIHRWIYEEVRLSMSKMSIMSLVLGLLFLGSLFFIIGFLAAVATLKSDEGGHSSQSVWQASNMHPQQEQAQDGQGGGKLGFMASTIGGSLAGNAVRKQLAPLGKVVGATSTVVPRPLQPFARYGIGSARAEVNSVGKQVNPFAPHRRMGIQEQQPYGGIQQQPSGIPQQYATPQVQPYGSPAPFLATSAGYQQPTAIPQGGQGGNGQGYAPMQQQPMMVQQPYYQQPLQQQPMVPQQMMTPQPQMMSPQQQQMMVQQPQMAPQQQQMMMQQPQYPQQMAPQQGYYR